MQRKSSCQAPGEWPRRPCLSQETCSRGRSATACKIIFIFWASIQLLICHCAVVWPLEELLPRQRIVVFSCLTNHDLDSFSHQSGFIPSSVHSPDSLRPRRPANAVLIDCPYLQSLRFLSCEQGSSLSSLIFRRQRRPRLHRIGGRSHIADGQKSHRNPRQDLPSLWCI